MRNMVFEAKSKLWDFLSLSGAVGVIFYIAHVVIGGFLWDGYSHVRQTISELTANGAPNADFLRVLTNVYGLLLVIFSIYMYVAMRKSMVHKAVIIGTIFFVVMQLSSFIGYSLFPLDLSAATSSFQNLMHIIVTIIVVICTIASSYCLGIGFFKSDKHKKIGFFILLCAVIITVSGILTPITMANNLGISGLTERINIFALQTWIFVLSLFLFAQSKKSITV
jgi:hypothetical protein